MDVEDADDFGDFEDATNTQSDLAAANVSVDSLSKDANVNQGEKEITGPNDAFGQEEPENVTTIEVIASEAHEFHNEDVTFAKSAATTLTEVGSVYVSADSDKRLGQTDDDDVEGNGGESSMESIGRKDDNDNSVVEIRLSSAHSPLDSQQYGPSGKNQEHAEDLAKLEATMCIDDIDTAVSEVGHDDENMGETPIITAVAFASGNKDSVLACKKEEEMDATNEHTHELEGDNYKQAQQTEQNDEVEKQANVDVANSAPDELATNEAMTNDLDGESSDERAAGSYSQDEWGDISFAKGDEDEDQWGEMAMGSDHSGSDDFDDFQFQESGQGDADEGQTDQNSSDDPRHHHNNSVLSPKLQDSNPTKTYNPGSMPNSSLLALASPQPDWLQAAKEVVALLYSSAPVEHSEAEITDRPVVDLSEQTLQTGLWMQLTKYHGQTLRESRELALTLLSGALCRTQKDATLVSSAPKIRQQDSSHREPVFSLSSDHGSAASVECGTTGMPSLPGSHTQPEHGAWATILPATLPGKLSAVQKSLESQSTLSTYSHNQSTLSTYSHNQSTLSTISHNHSTQSSHSHSQSTPSTHSDNQSATSVYSYSQSTPSTPLPELPATLSTTQASNNDNISLDSTETANDGNQDTSAILLPIRPLAADQEEKKTTDIPAKPSSSTNSLAVSEPSQKQQPDPQESAADRAVKSEAQRYIRMLPDLSYMLKSTVEPTSGQ